MDLKDQIKQLGERVNILREQIQTEEATKNAFIMPFIQYLGYDVFNPLEVVPEYVTDIGTKKGEKIDYAILDSNGSPIILIECKHWAQNLNLHDGQLLRYFHVSKARFGILTNGITYRFYSDLVEQNKMDEKPFLEFSIDEIRENQIEELKKFHKSYFNAESIINTASDLKYTNELKLLLINELSNPSSDFVKHFAKQVYQGVVTAKMLDQFTNLLKKSTQHFMNELITDRFKTALKNEDDHSKELIEEQIQSDDKIVTTNEEIEGFMIVKSILRQTIQVNRIFYRDSQSYFAILLDDNNRKTICRLYFNRTKKYFVTLDESKKEIKFQIETLDEIYNFTDDLIKIVKQLDQK